MTEVEAIAIFKDIRAVGIPSLKKREAIKIVLRMDKQTAVTKAELIDAFRWLHGIGAGNGKNG